MKQTSWYLNIQAGSIDEADVRFQNFMSGISESDDWRKIKPCKIKEWVIYEFDDVCEDLYTLSIIEANSFFDIKVTDYYGMKDLHIEKIWGFFKRGDVNNKKDLQLCGIVDEREQINGFEISDEMKKIFLVLPIHKSCRRELLDKIKESENNIDDYRWCLDKRRLPKKLKLALYTHNGTKASDICVKDVDILEMPSVENYLIKKNTFDPIQDVNAWVGGNVTVGSSGTYATWTALAADLGTFIVDGEATQISTITESSTVVFNTSVSSYNMVLNGGLRKVSYGGNEYCFQMDVTGTGNLDIKHFEFQRTSTSSTFLFSAVYIRTVGASIGTNIYENIFDGGGFVGSGIRCVTSSPVLDIYSNIFYDYDGDSSSSGIVIDASDGNSSSTYINNTSYNCGKGFEFNSNDGNVLNCASFDSTGNDFNNTGSLTTFTKCASSDTTGSEAGLRSLIGTTVFESVTSTDGDFLYPVQGETLHGAGANTPLSDHLYYYNGRVLIDDDIDIGGNGLTFRPTAATSSSDTYSSSIDSLTDLVVDVTYYTSNLNAPICVIMHGYTQSASNITTDIKTRFANYGFFVAVPGMRGRDGASGSRDASGREIYDIYDAIQHVIVNYSTYVDETNINIIGYSGGGGNVFNFVCKFPDLAGVASSFFGMNDYGYDSTDGWYYTNTNFQSALETDIGGSPSEVIDSYRARMSLYAAKNAKYSEMFVYHDTSDSSVSAINAVNWDSEFTSLGYTNLSTDLTGPGEYPRWDHGLPFDGDPLVKAEIDFYPDIINGTYKNPSIDSSGTFNIIGYIRSKEFEIFLNDGNEDTAILTYDLNTGEYTLDNTDTNNNLSAVFKFYNKTPNTNYRFGGRIGTSDEDGTVLFYITQSTGSSTYYLVEDNLIGNLNVSDVAFILLAEAESDFRFEDSNTGFAHLYNGPAASELLTATLTSFPINNGYIYNNGNAYHKFDGLAGKIVTTYDLDLTNTSNFTYISHVDFTPGTNNIILGKLVDSSNRFFFNINSNNSPEVFIRIGGTIRLIETNDTVSTNDFVALVKNEESVRIYINGVEVTYATQDSYDLGDYTFNDIQLGNEASSYYTGNIKTGIFYERALPPAELIHIYNLGPSLGNLRGVDNDDGSMDLLPSIGSNNNPLITSITISSKIGNIY